MEENNEVMEPMVVEDNNVEVYENSDSCEKKSSLGLILAGAAAVGAVGTLLYRKLRKKKTGKKRKLVWIEVPDDPDEEDVVELEEETTEIETSEEA